MRLFLGIDASTLVFKKDELKKLRIGLNQKEIEHRIEPLEQLHITLISLGDMEEKAYEEKAGYINNIVQAHTQFELKLHGIHVYPSSTDGRVLWIGVQNSRDLRSLEADLCQQISSFCELNFKPILPIVRLRNHKNLNNIISPYKTHDFGVLKVETVVLYEMISGGAFPVFKQLKTYYLDLPIEESQVGG